MSKKNQLEARRAQDLIKAVADQYGVTPECIAGKRRSKIVAEARQVAMFLCYHKLKWSVSEVSWFFDVTHGTVFYAINRVERMLGNVRFIRKHFKG